MFYNSEVESFSLYVDGIEDIQTVEFYFNGKLKKYYEMKKGLVDGELLNRMTME